MKVDRDIRMKCHRIVRYSNDIKTMCKEVRDYLIMNGVKAKDCDRTLRHFRDGENVVDILLKELNNGD